MRFSVNFKVHDITGLYCSSVMYFSQQYIDYKIQILLQSLYTGSTLQLSSYEITNFFYEKKISTIQALYTIFLSFFFVFFKLELIDII